MERKLKKRRKSLVLSLTADRWSPAICLSQSREKKSMGTSFIPDVFAKGAAAVLSEQQLEDPAGPYILVESTTKALRDLAEYYRKSLDIKVVGITGSVGKTSTKEMIASVLSEKYRVLKTEGKLQQRDRTSAHNL